MTIALSKLNFRDLGGLPAGEGRKLRVGMLYRNEGPASLKEEHRCELLNLGIRLICDLRADVERAAAPNDWTTARLLNLDVAGDLRVKTSAGWAALRDDRSEASAKAAMRANYAAIPGAMLPHLGSLFDAILAGETPVLIHCTAGKDRTGVLVALLLLLLEVPGEHVVEDYLRSDVFGKNLRLSGSLVPAFEKSFGFAPSEATMAAIIDVHPEFLNAALDAVERDWGSVEGYFAAAGVDEGRRAALRGVLVEDDEAAGL